jgi:hypothetical protein
VIDAQSSSWAKESDLGEMLSRSDVADHRMFDDAFLISDAILLHDRRLSQALSEE